MLKYQRSKELLWCMHFLFFWQKVLNYEYRFVSYKFISTTIIHFSMQFDLVCDRFNLAELLQTLVIAGQLVGSACTSSLSDRVGRKTVHLCCNILTLIFGISVAFSPNYTMLAAMKFILGLLLQVNVLCDCVKKVWL